MKSIDELLKVYMNPLDRLATDDGFHLWTPFNDAFQRGVRSAPLTADEKTSSLFFARWNFITVNRLYQAPLDLATAAIDGLALRRKWGEPLPDKKALRDKKLEFRETARLEIVTWVEGGGDLDALDADYEKLRRKLGSGELSINFDDVRDWIPHPLMRRKQKDGRPLPVDTGKPSEWYTRYFVQVNGQTYIGLEGRLAGFAYMSALSVRAECTRLRKRDDAVRPTVVDQLGTHQSKEDHVSAEAVDFDGYSAQNALMAATVRQEETERLPTIAYLVTKRLGLDAGELELAVEWAASALLGKIVATEYLSPTARAYYAFLVTGIDSIDRSTVEPDDLLDPNLKLSRALGEWFEYPAGRWTGQDLAETLRETISYLNPIGHAREIQILRALHPIQLAVLRINLILHMPAGAIAGLDREETVGVIVPSELFYDEKVTLAEIANGWLSRTIRQWPPLPMESALKGRSSEQLAAQAFIGYIVFAFIRSCVPSRTDQRPHPTSHLIKHLFVATNWRYRGSFGEWLRGLRDFLLQHGIQLPATAQENDHE